MILLGPQKTLKKIVNTIVETVYPERIILFGSRTRKDYREHSDYDLMVIKKHVRNEREISKRIYRALFENKIARAVDVIVVDTDKLKVRARNPYLIYAWALKEGKVVYG